MPVNIQAITFCCASIAATCSGEESSSMPEGRWSCYSNTESLARIYNSMPLASHSDCRGWRAIHCTNDDSAQETSHPAILCRHYSEGLSSALLAFVVSTLSTFIKDGSHCYTTCLALDFSSLSLRTCSSSGHACAKPTSTITVNPSLSSTRLPCAPSMLDTERVEST